MTGFIFHSWYKSKSDPTVRYKVYQNKSGQIVACTCPGFWFRQKCRHVEQARTRLLQKAGVE